MVDNRAALVPLTITTMYSDHGLLLLAELQSNGKLILFIYQYLFF